MLPASFFFLSIVLGSALILGAKIRRIPRSVQFLLLGAFAVRVLYIAIDNVLQIFAGDGDFLLYDEALWYVAQQWRVGDFLAPLTFLDGNYFLTVYTYTYASVYTLFGHHPSLVRLLVALTGVLFVYNIYRIAQTVSGHKSGTYAAGFAAIFPYWIQLSGIFYRDMLVMLFLTEVIFLLLQWVDSDRSHRQIVVVVPLIIFVLTLRPINLIPIGSAFAIATYIKLGESKWQKPLAVITLLGAVLGIALFYGDKITVHELANRRAWLARESPAAYLTGIIYDNIVELLAFLPIGIGYFVLVPLPWQLMNPLAVVALLQNIALWYPVLALSPFGIQRLVPDRNSQLAILLLYFTSGVAVYGLVEGNIGPAMRHRSQFQFVVVVLAAIAVAERVQVKIDTDF